jgi:hypothetical protein
MLGNPWLLYINKSFSICVTSIHFYLWKQVMKGKIYSIIILSLMYPYTMITLIFVNSNAVWGFRIDNYMLEEEGLRLWASRL